jgi:hypothetical protein
MYDMYPWDGPGTTGSTDDDTPQDPATAAVQVALDRRDNGGDHVAAPAAAVPGHQ